MEQSLITIGLTCYNAEATIARALECALAQDWKNTEILVVDDGSSDGSVGIVEGYLVEDARIRLIRHGENKGCPHTRNTILANFKGEYLAFFDDDDYSYPTRLTDQFARLAARGEDRAGAVCYANLERVDPGRTEPSRVMKGMGWTPPEPDADMLMGRVFLGEEYPGHSMGVVGTNSLMAHRDLFAAVGLFDTHLKRAQDTDYAIRTGLAGKTYVAVDKVLVRYYVNADKGKKAKILTAHRYLARKYKPYLIKRSMYTYALLMAHAKAHEFCGEKWRFKIFRSLAKRVKKISLLWHESRPQTS